MLFYFCLLNTIHKRVSSINKYVWHYTIKVILDFFVILILSYLNFKFYWYCTIMYTKIHKCTLQWKLTINQNIIQREKSDLPLGLPVGVIGFYHANNLKTNRKWWISLNLRHTCLISYTWIKNFPMCFRVPFI